jgi:hypothetical protein
MPKNDEGGQVEFPRAIGKPATRALASAGYTHLDQLVFVREKDLSGYTGWGRKRWGFCELPCASGARTSRGNSGCTQSSEVVQRNDPEARAINAAFPRLEVGRCRS